MTNKTKTFFQDTLDTKHKYSRWNRKHADTWRKRRDNRASNARSLQVINLSDVTLSRSQIALLKRGLQFAPTPRQTAYTFDSEWTEFRRRIRLSFTFGKSSTLEPGFRVRSGYDPGKLTNHPDVEILLNQLKQKLTDKIKDLLNRYPPANNLTNGELKALEELKLLCNRIIIKPADKGSAVVIMNIQDYVQEGLRQLTNATYYIPSDGLLKASNAILLRKWAQDMYDKNYISRKVLKFLLPPTIIEQRTFYLLPKIHKPGDKWPSAHMPPGRPIVTNLKTELSNPSKWLDYWLQPLNQSLFKKSLVKDSYDFIDRIKRIRIPLGTPILLIAADVQDLYTNIPHDSALRSICGALNENRCPGRPHTSMLLRLLRIILENNDMEFAGTYYRQIRGISMGNNCAPSIANLYMEKVDKIIRSYNPLGYFRFIDDQFWVWDASRTDLEHMKTEVKNACPYINIIYNSNDSMNTFLDVEVRYYKDREHLEFKVHFKPTDTHQLLHKRSCHPPHTCRGIIKAQLIRFKRLCSKEEYFEEASRTLFGALTERGYSETFLVGIKGQLYVPPNMSTTPRKDFLPLVLRWDPLLNDLPRWLHTEWEAFWNLDGDNQKFLPLSVLIAWKRNPNLYNKLVKAKTPHGVYTPPVDNGGPPNDNDP